jgi:hypothetical protein
LAIYLGNELGMQVDYDTVGNGQVYPEDSQPGDFGTFVVVDGALYAPDFDNHPNSAVDIGTYTPFTPVSQTAVSGAGTSTDPYTVVTVVNAGSTGISIEQTVEYVDGEDTFSTQTVLTNNSGTAHTVLLYRAMDCYLGGDDEGYGMVAGNLVACVENENNTPPGLIEGLYAQTPGFHYIEDEYDVFWQLIGQHIPFPNTCGHCGSPADKEDNGMGLSWGPTAVPAGGTITVSDIAAFSPLGDIPIPKPPAPASAPAIGPGALVALGLLLAMLAMWMVHVRRKTVRGLDRASTLSPRPSRERRQPRRQVPG